MNGFTRRVLCLLMVLLPGARPLWGATITWDGGGDGVTWSDRVNWSGDALPGPADHAVIALAGNHMVRLTAEVSISGITLGGTAGTQSLDINGFRLSLGTDTSVVEANGVLIIGGVTFPQNFALSIDGPLVVRGRCDWTNGQAYANTYYQPPAGRIITIDTGGLMRWIGSHERWIGATLENKGTLRWEGGITYFVQGYSHSNSGLFEIDVDSAATFRRAGINSIGPWIFTNTGAVRKTGVDTATIQVELQTIGGTVEVRQGILRQNYTSRWENSTISVDSGARLLLQANRDVEPHIVAGSLSGTIAGTLLLSGIPGSGYFTTLAADTAMGGELNIRGTGLQIDYGELGGVYYTPPGRYGSAPTNVGLLRFVGSSIKGIRGSFINKDTLRWEAGGLDYHASASFANEGVFEMAVDSSWEFRTVGINGTRPGPFMNTGLIVKTGAGTVTSRVDFHTIGGAVDINQGAIVQEDPSRWENVRLSVDSGATMQLAGYSKEHVIAGTLTGDVAGTFLASGRVFSYFTHLVADTIMGGRLEVDGTGLQLVDCRIGLSANRPAPVNGGLLRFVGFSFQQVGSNLRNEGMMRWERGNPNADPGVTIANSGTFEILGSGGRFSGQATLVNEAQGITRKIDTGVATFAMSVVNNGRLSIEQGTLVVNNTGSNQFQSNDSALIAGRGRLELHSLPAQQLTNTGAVAPGPGDDGSGVGWLTITGPLPYRFFDIELAGTDSAQHDRLIIAQGSPDISLDTMFVRALGSFVPATSDFFDVILGPVVGELEAVISRQPAIQYTASYPPNIVRLGAGPIGPGGSDTIEVTAPIVAARQGEFVDVPVTIVAPQAARARGVTRVNATLRFNSTLLVPIESTPDGAAVGTEREIAVQTLLSQTGDTTITTLRFRATLGDDSTTALTISQASSDSVSVPITRRDGLFRLLDLCYEGGPRLLNPSGAIALRGAHPNPLSDRLFLDLELSEVGATTILMTDMTGDQVRTFVNGVLPRGRLSVSLDMRDIPSGRYFVIVQTPTVRLSRQIEVIQ